jgi:hypothetical protein
VDELAYGPDDMWDQTCRGTSWVHTPVTHGLSAYGSGASCLLFVAVKKGIERCGVWPFWTLEIFRARFPMSR